MGRAHNQTRLSSQPRRDITAGFENLGAVQATRQEVRSWMPSAPSTSRDPFLDLEELWEENAFMVMGTIERLIRQALKEDETPRDEIAKITDAYLKEAMSGDNAHLIEVSKEYLEKYLYYEEPETKPRRQGFDFERFYGANAMEVIAQVQQVLREIIEDKDELKEISARYLQETMSGNYTNVIETSRRYLWEYGAIETPAPDDSPRCLTCNGLLENPNARYCLHCS